MLGLLASCARAGTGPPEPAQDIVLSVGESALVAGVTVRVAAVEDSRCPSDVVCITSGDVVVLLAYSGAGAARTDTLRLNTTPRTSAYGGLVFQPTTITPYPDTRAGATTKTVTLHVTPAP